MPARFRRTALVVMLAAGLSVSGCDSSADAVDYIIDGALPTYNTASVVGAASGAPQAFSRVQTGFNFRGPDGQVVADRDFGTVSVVGRAPLILDYKINDSAVYSDGKPVTCDDMVLAWAAQSGLFPAFDAASRAGYIDVAAVDCTPGQKRARVTFVRDRDITDYGQLFAATSMLPAHVLDDALGLGDGGVAKALETGDGPTIDKWLTVFLKRFMANQFKRTAMPNGPKVGSGGSLSPRGDWRSPSDATARPWLDDLR